MNTDTIDLRPEFPALDTLRAVGAVAVLTTHVAFQTGEYFRHGTWGVVLARMDMGVAIFFVLSGFLLSRAWWARAFSGLAAPDVGRYAVKRVARIVPIYLVTVVIALSLMSENAERGVSDWLRTLTMTDTFFARSLAHGLTQMWSLAVEATFYLVLPLLMLVLVRPTRGVVGRCAGFELAALVAVNVAWLIWAAPSLSDVRPWSPSLWLPGYLTWFAAGIWLAREHVLEQAGRPTRLGAVVMRVGSQPGVCVTIVAGVLLMAATPLAGPVTLDPATDFQAVVKNLLYGIIGLLLVAWGLRSRRDSALGRLATSHVLRHLGHISYGIFCLHLLVLAAITHLIDYRLFTGDFPLIWVATLAGSIVVSEVTYRLVERPAMRMASPRRASQAAQKPTRETATSTK